MITNPLPGCDSDIVAEAKEILDDLFDPSGCPCEDCDLELAAGGAR